MSPRIKKLRKILEPPPIKGFKPYGLKSDSKGKKIIELHFEEYEALKLCDYDMHNHKEASAIMGVSRPTFTRIYASVRQKIAQAFAEGKQISIEGGKVYFDSDWYHCKSCDCFFNNPQKDIEIFSCPLCRSQKISSYNPDSEMVKDNNKICNNLYKCSICGFENETHLGKPCGQELCPECNKPMKRRGKPKGNQNTNHQL